ncbi:hypothetical protein J0A67_04790 [Algoriphagus aestuariicola]|uniref:Uncharacterized protein n=1 Tax=Algoriphagus aestuariicola TaxID=1852016 RepID=A0ABS3BM74_9BACT|nr:hypothetical protein [Algoriphagus aestuariicola]MBN7800165.1 hypothetical protein [Algoriphagus aestuariicola]
MVKLVVSTFALHGKIWLFLDEELISTGSSTRELELKIGESYVLHWVIKGNPGSTYSISVSSPREAQYLLTRVIGVGEKEFGGYKFST